MADSTTKAHVDVAALAESLDPQDAEGTVAQALALFPDETTISFYRFYENLAERGELPAAGVISASAPPPADSTEITSRRGGSVAR